MADPQQLDGIRRRNREDPLGEDEQVTLGDCWRAWPDATTAAVILLGPPLYLLAQPLALAYVLALRAQDAVTSDTVYGGQ